MAESPDLAALGRALLIDGRVSDVVRTYPDDQLAAVLQSVVWAHLDWHRLPAGAEAVLTEAIERLAGRRARKDGA